VGLKNPGYWGIDVKKTKKYTGSFYSYGEYDAVSPSPWCRISPTRRSQPPISSPSQLHTLGHNTRTSLSRPGARQTATTVLCWSISRGRIPS
jgi:hypothetical protein